MQHLTTPTKAKDIQRAWHLIDVKDQVLGRIATRITKTLMGTSKPYYVPYLDCGDYVVVINTKYVQVTGKKAQQKIYDRFSGYPGGRGAKIFSQVLQENPGRIITDAVSGMLPKNKLRDLLLKRLFVFADEKHPYETKLKVKS